MNNVGISLGWNCHSVVVGVNHGLRKEDGYKTCVFDTMISNFDGVVECIKDDFAFFTDEKYLILDHEFDKPNDPCIFNTKYKFGFNHESPYHANLYEQQQWPEGREHFMIDNYRNFKERFNRRIQNFRDYLNDPNNHIIFILTTWNKTEEELKPLRNALMFRYPNLSYEIKQYNDPNGKEYLARHLRIMKYNTHDYELKRLYPEQNTKLKFNIGLHMAVESDGGGGGAVVQYQLAKLLRNKGYDVRIIKAWQTNELATSNEYFSHNPTDCVDDFDPRDDYTITIYCEGVKGNPLNGKKIVRWMLSELGRNVPISNADTWDKNEVVYYFNEEPKITSAPEEKKNSIYKYLSVVLFNDKVKHTNNGERKYSFFTHRKGHYHSNLHYIHPENTDQIVFHNDIVKNIEIFNSYEMGYIYDPLTMITFMAPACGCMSIVFPYQGKSRMEWLNIGTMGRYLRENTHGETDIYGIAYGDSEEQLTFAKQTLYLAPQQWENMKEFFTHRDLDPFLEDMHNFENLKNRKDVNF